MRGEEEMEESKKVYVHYEGSPEYTHVARITWGFTVEQLAVEFTKVYNAKHGRMVCLDPALIHLLNGRRRMSKSANLIKLVKDRSDIFVEHEIPSPTAGLVSSSASKDEIPTRANSLVKCANPSAPKEEKKQMIWRRHDISPLETVFRREEVTSGVYFKQEQDSAFEANLIAAAKRVPEVGQGQEMREPFICAVLVRAIKAQQMMKYKFAGNIFSKVLTVLPKQQVCLRGLGSIALKLRNYSEALTWLQRGVEEYPKDALFHTRLGDAYSGIKQYKDALSEYDLALGLAMDQNLKLTEKISGVDNLASSKLTLELELPKNLLDKINYDPTIVEDPNAGDILGPVTIDGLNVACAVVFFKRGAEGDLELAEHLLKTVLAQNSENKDALHEYGTLMLSQGHVKGALRIFLKLLVSKSGDESIRSSVSKAVKRPQGIELLKEEVAVAPEAAPVLAFLASCVKDYGAIDESIELYNLAIKLNPLSVGYFLSLIHLHEVMYEYLRALGLAVSMFGMFPTFTLSNLQFSDVLPYFEGPNWTESPDNISQQCQHQGLKFMSRAEFFRWFDNLPNRAFNDSDSTNWSGGESKKQKGTCTYNDQQLDGLAVLFTVTKILFLGGALDRAKQLARLIEPARVASVKPLHQTIIRNEAAYFTSVQQILEQYYIPLPLPPLKEQPPLFLAGDSHCLSAAWRTVRLRGQNRLLVPMLVTGLKVWHLRPESQFYPKNAFQNIMQSVANGAQLVMVYGEIDCRESILASVEKGVYKDVEHGVEVVVNIYFDVLQHLIFSRGFELFVHPVPPVLNETRAVVLVFNRILKGRIEALKEKSALGKRIHWLDFAQDLLTDGGSLREPYKLDGTHLSPKYASLLQRELRKVK